MTREIIAANIRDMRAASASNGGTALSTTAAFILIPPGSQYLTILPRNFATAVVAKCIPCPYGVVLVRRGAFRPDRIADYTDIAQDNDTETDLVLNAFPAVGSDGFVYVGSPEKFRGARLDVDGANADASVLTVRYWNGNAWANITATDGTASGGATMAVDGNIIWTVPTGDLWKPGSLDAIENEGKPSGVPFASVPMFWDRWEFSIALGAATSINSLILLNKSVAYAELTPGELREFSIETAPGGWSAIEALTNAGTANLVVNCYIVRGGGRFR